MEQLDALPSSGAHPLFAEGPSSLTETPFEDRFRALRVRQIISELLRERLGGATYQPDGASAWARDLADEVKRRVKAEPWAWRYKLAVQAVVGEQRGEGCHVAARCFWDTAADGWARETFSNDSVFCIVAVFGCYMY